MNKLIFLRVIVLATVMLLVISGWLSSMSNTAEVSEWVKSSEEIKMHLGDVRNIRILRISTGDTQSDTASDYHNSYLVEVFGTKGRALVGIEERPGGRFRLKAYNEVEDTAH